MNLTLTQSRWNLIQKYFLRINECSRVWNSDFRFYNESCYGIWLQFIEKPSIPTGIWAFKLHGVMPLCLTFWWTIKWAWIRKSVCEQGGLTFLVIILFRWTQFLIRKYHSLITMKGCSKDKLTIVYHEQVYKVAFGLFEFIKIWKWDFCILDF